MAEKTKPPNGPVVVGIDGSEPGFTALRHAAREAEWRGVTLHVVHVLDVSPAVLHLEGDRTIHTRELAESDRAEIWEKAGPILQDAPIEVMRVELDGNPGKTLIAYCSEAGGSVLVVGPRGRGRVGRWLLGSTADQAVKGAMCDVLVVKPGAEV
ncbi:MAG TPA: universal stress protein [Acidimicrobiia bacterium]|jgi:nucleotide-binding universal stress UspA family protein|nr:universal stress protein [Acidimicrobiia bacterium]